MTRQELLVQMRDATDEDQLSTLPIVGIVNGKPTLDRTGILLSIAHLDFLVTAAHGMQQIVEHGIPLYVTSPRKSEGGIAINGEIHGISEKIVDIAIIRLDSATAQSLRSSGAKFLRVTDTDVHAPPISGYYLLRGFPHQLKGSRMRYSTDLYVGSTPQDLQYPFDPNVHLLLEHSDTVVDNDGMSGTSPVINGMSGCGIWRLTSRPEIEWGSWKKVERKLVAIQTGCMHGQYFKGTWINVVWQMIQQHYPEVGGVMDKLWLPS